MGIYRNEIRKMSEKEYLINMIGRFQHVAGLENFVIAKMDIEAGRHGTLMDRYDQKVLYTY